MKKIHIIIVILALFMLNTSCENDGGTSVIPLENGALSNLTRTDGSLEFIVNTTFTSVDLEFNIELVYGDPVSYDLMALYKTIDGDFYGPVVIDANVTNFTKDYVISGSQVIDAFDEISSSSDLTAGDNIFFYPSFTMKNGTTLATLNSEGETNYYAADFNQIGGYSYFVAYPVVCGPKPGEYRIVMHDSYGDGWQTDDGNGGSGITVILDGDVQEVGMCSPYQASAFECTPTADGFEADEDAIITIPEGTEIAQWIFPGDAYGEISFEIYGPDNQLLLASGVGEADAGPLTVVLCAD
ncbi:MAG: hypothetical protein ACM31G_01525 [Flavobacteriales bacterium]